MNIYWWIFIGSIVAIFILKLFIARRKYATYEESEENIWKIETSAQKEMPAWPKSRNGNKNENGIYIERLAIIEQTIAELYWDETQQQEAIHLTEVAGEKSALYPIFTTNHNNEEHFLTQLYISFHSCNQQYFLDIVSMDEDYQLDQNTILRFKFDTGKVLVLQFEKSKGNIQNRHFVSLAITVDELSLFKNHRIDKWIIENKNTQICAIGSLNFDVRKYIYKPEIQYTIQLMATKIWELTLKSKH